MKLQKKKRENARKSPFFAYSAIGQVGRIFGRIISAETDRIFGRIFGIGRTLKGTLH